MLTVRAMQQSDLATVLAAERVLQTSPWTRGNFVDSFVAGHGLWVATEAQAITAYAVSMLVEDEAQLLNIGVLPPHQAAGRGRALLESLLTIVRDAGAQRMFLEVRAGNLPAQRLYVRAGFAEIGRRKGYYPAPDKREDAIVMARDL